MLQLLRQRPSKGESVARLAICLLGTFQVTLAERPVSGFESDKVRALLAYLAVESERPHRREKLASLLWPNRPMRNARRNLSQALYNLRHAIGDGDAEPLAERVQRLFRRLP